MFLGTLDHHYNYSSSSTILLYYSCKILKIDTFSTIISLVFIIFGLLLPKINAKMQKTDILQHKSKQKLYFQKSSRLSWQNWVFSKSNFWLLCQFLRSIFEIFQKTRVVFKNSKCQLSEFGQYLYLPLMVYELQAKRFSHFFCISL